jgi:metallo-beta-lactamase class B
MTICKRLLAAAAFAGLGMAQPPSSAALKPDSEMVKALIEKAKKAGGARWAEEAHFFCEAPRPNSSTDPVIEATQIFDNAYVIGNQGTIALVLKTSQGLLMIDALSANETDTQLLPGFKKLGLDPAQVKMILVGHGHADHFGGAAYFQERFGAKIYVSAADWDVMANPPAGPGGKKGPAVPLPKRDQVLQEGQDVVLGDLKVTPIAVPGHTPGSMGFLFAVKDKGKSRVAAMYAGTVLTPGIVSDEGLATYRKSVDHFQEVTKKAKVEVELQNHPLMDPIQPKLDALKSQGSGANPFVVGRDQYQKFLAVMGACTDVNIARRKGQ